MNALRSSMLMAAPPERIYALAAQTERWPSFLPHYRHVGILEDDGRRRIVDMAAWRGAIPVRWRAEQRNDASRPAVFFRHLTGWARDMEVEWRFERTGDGTLVTIVHDIEPVRFPIFREVFAHAVVGSFFIDNIAGKTLARIKSVSEDTSDA